MRPGIFIGSSSEGLEIAKALQYHLSEFADATIWTDNVFQLSKSNMENLLKILDNSNYGVFILSSDDFISSRGTNEYAPRDNVIFELGLFAGRLGMHKTYVVHHKNEKPKIPTDIMGITLASYHEYSSGNLIAALSSASMLIKQSITENESVKKIPSETIKIDMTWDCMCSASKRSRHF